MRTIRRVAAAVTVIVGLTTILLATYYSTVINPNEADSQPYVRSSPAIPPKLTIEDLTELNREFKTVAHTTPPATETSTEPDEPRKSSIAPSDLDNFNGVIAANWTATEWTNPLRASFQLSTSAVNAEFNQVRTASFLALNDAEIVNSYIRTVAYEQSPRSVQTAVPVRSRPKPTWIEKLFSGLTRDLENNPKAVVLPLLIGLLYYLATVLGILANAVYDALDMRSSSTPITPRSLLGMAFRAGGWQGIMFSPVIFGLVLGAMKTDAASMSMTLLAFQNGFFWRGTLKKVAEKFGEPTKPKPAPKAKDKKNKKP